MTKKDRFSLAASVAVLLGTATASGAVLTDSTTASGQIPQAQVIHVQLADTPAIDAFILESAQPTDIAAAHESHSSHSSHVSHASHSSHSSHYSSSEVN